MPVTALKRLHHDFGVVVAQRFYGDDFWFEECCLH
jgi:hypothetical protein